MKSSESNLPPDLPAYVREAITAVPTHLTGLAGRRSFLDAFQDSLTTDTTIKRKNSSEGPWLTFRAPEKFVCSVRIRALPLVPGGPELNRLEINVPRPEVPTSPIAPWLFKMTLMAEELAQPGMREAVLAAATGKAHSWPFPVVPGLSTAWYAFSYWASEYAGAFYQARRQEGL